MFTPEAIECATTGSSAGQGGGGVCRFGELHAGTWRRDHGGSLSENHLHLWGLRAFGCRLPHVKKLQQPSRPLNRYNLPWRSHHHHKPKGCLTFPLITWICCRGRDETSGRARRWLLKVFAAAECRRIHARLGCFFFGFFVCFSFYKEKSLGSHRQKRREPFPPSPSSPSPNPGGIRGSSAERVRPQKRIGDKSFLVAVNFQPMWERQVRHWATVQAYLRAKRQKQRGKGSGLFARCKNKEE